MPTKAEARSYRRAIRLGLGPEIDFASRARTRKSIQAARKERYGRARWLRMLIRNIEFDQREGRGPGTYLKIKKTHNRYGWLNTGRHVR